jgi:hypothetical protein
MGLIDLKTNLKTLKYGNDQKGGGSSNQPYIVAPIPDGYTENASDFLLRNGRLNLVSSEQDVSRLTKLFKDTKSPNGLQFIAKQELLERQNVEVPGGLGRIYNPLNTLAQAGVTSIGYHLNKQGLDPFARGYFNGGSSGYYKTTLRDNELDINRLYGLYKIKQINSRSNPPETSLLSSIYNISSNPSYLFSYSGGPGSVLGIGNTNIRVIGDGYGNPLERTNTYKLSNNDGIYTFDYELINTYLNTDYSDLESLQTDDIPNIVDRTKSNKRNSKTVIITTTNDYRRAININLGEDVLASTDYVSFNRSDTYNQQFYNGPRLNPNTSYSKNLISITPPTTRNIQGQTIGQAVDNLKFSDIIKFFIEVISNDSNDSNQNVILFFRAYIDSISDGFKADWNSFKYVGRAENFYKYGGFSRNFSISFTVVAESREEMLPIYQKLNYLASLTAPDYSGLGLMRGNFIKLNIGDYMSDVPCIIESIDLKPNFDAGWDINRGPFGEPLDPNTSNPLLLEDNPYTGQLPRMINVDMSIIPLHTFTPQLNQPYIGNTKHRLSNEILNPPATTKESPTPPQTQCDSFTQNEINRLDSGNNADNIIGSL